MKFSAAILAVLLAGAAPAGAIVTIEPKPLAIEAAAAPESVRPPVPSRNWLAVGLPGLLAGLLLVSRIRPRAPHAVTA